MQCNAGYAKQRSYIFVYTWASINGCGRSVLRDVVVNAREFSAPYESRQLLGESALKFSRRLGLALGGWFRHLFGALAH